MKKFVSLLLVLLLAFAVMVPAALADNTVLEADVEEVTTFDRTSPVTDWEGEWVLAAAVIGEDYADENDIDTTGLIAVPENAVKMNVVAIYDGSATGSDAGVMVDQASYLHAHVYDMEATVTFAEDIADEEATLKLPWDGWLFTVRGENDGDFNMGVGMVIVASRDTADKALAALKENGCFVLSHRMPAVEPHRIYDLLIPGEPVFITIIRKFLVYVHMFLVDE